MIGWLFLGAGALSATPSDTQGPSVSSVSIEDDETDGTFVRVTFDEDIDPDSLVFGNISLTVNAVSRGISTPTWESASVLEFATDTPVYTGQTCLLTVAAGAVEDLAENANELQSDIAVTNNSTRTPLTAQEIAQELRSPTKRWHMLVIGDSRHSSNEQYFIEQMPGVLFTGVEAPYLIAADNAAFDSETPAANDPNEISISPLIGGPLDWFFPGGVVESEFTGAAVAGGGSVLKRLAYPPGGVDAATLPTLWARLDAGGDVLVRAPVLLHAGGHTTLGVRVSVRQDGATAFTDPGCFQGPYLYDSTGDGYTELTCTIPGAHDWTTYDTPYLDIVGEGSVAATAGQIFTCYVPWLELDDNGIVLHCCAQGGWSLDGWLSEYHQQVWTNWLPRLGENVMVMIGLGTNNPAGNTNAQHKTKILSQIERIRTANPAAPIILTTEYEHETSTSALYYLPGLVEIAAEEPAVLLCDTFSFLPSYENGVALGLYADGVHFNPEGEDYFYDTINDMIAIAAGDATEVDTILGAKLEAWLPARKVTVVSSRVRLNDLSGNNHRFSALDAADDPGRDMSGGRPALVFNGSANELTSDDASTVWDWLHEGNDRATVWSVIEPSGSGTIRWAFASTSGSTASGIGIRVNAANNYEVIHSNGSTATLATSAGLPLARTLVRLDLNAGVISLAAYQAGGGTSTASNTHAAPATGGGRLPQIGNRTASGGLYVGNILDTVIARDASDAERDAVTTRLREYYGLT